MKNIIFDIGGVIVSWQEDELLDGYTKDVNLSSILRDGILYHQSWKDYDHGLLDEQSAIMAFAKNTGLSSSECYDFVDYCRHSLRLNSETLFLIETLKKDYSVYSLSNTPESFMVHIKKHFSFMDLFDGSVYSSDVKLLKPMPEIYQCILTKYDLLASECIFIDDRLENVTAAEEVGMIGIEFKSVEQCKAKLLEFIRIGEEEC